MCSEPPSDAPYPTSFPFGVGAEVIDGPMAPFRFGERVRIEQHPVALGGEVALVELRHLLPRLELEIEPLVVGRGEGRNGGDDVGQLVESRQQRGTLGQAVEHLTGTGVLLLEPLHELRVPSDRRLDPAIGSAITVPK